MDLVLSCPTQFITLEVDTLETEQHKLKKSFVHDLSLTHFNIAATFDLHQCLLAQKPVAPVHIQSHSQNFENIELRLALTPKRKQDELNKITLLCRVTP